ncbi:MAG: LytTR family transcriptional regulator [Bacteroidales bacterium]|nr:LytTR family transcriptional regulator [Bacteroidales bacterium]
MERIIIIDDHLCKEELAEFLEANKKHIKLDSSFEQLKSSTKIFFEELLEIKNGDEKIIFNSDQNINFVRTKEIVSVNAFGRYCKIILKNGSILETNQDLDSIEKKLPRDFFMRIHALHLINLDYLASCKLNIPPSIIMNNGEILPLDENKKAEVIKYLENLTKNSNNSMIY